MNNLTKKKPNEDLVLTRYLYAKDEVFLSMISAMLTHNLNETLFWFGEWITAISFQEATQEIWRIYYDFYSIKNPVRVIFIHLTSESFNKYFFYH